jgi:hypothetical protein
MQSTKYNHVRLGCRYEHCQVTGDAVRSGNVVQQKHRTAYLVEPCRVGQIDQLIFFISTIGRTQGVFSTRQN